jgi:transcription antitermination factor NusG
LPETVTGDLVVPSTSLAWHVLWTRSNCERMVHDQLTAKGFAIFLPTTDVWSRRGGARVLERVPLFRGYLFLHRAMDKAAYLEICQTRGLVRLLGGRWDRLEVVPDTEIGAIQAVLRSGVTILPHPYLREGQPVRITGGPLANVEGVLLESDPDKGTFVISVHLLRRSIAVRLDCTRVEAA